MNSQLKKLAAVATSIVLSSFNTAYAGGCGSHGGVSFGLGGGGINIGLGGGHVHLPSHSMPSQHVHSYPQPSYQQPSFPQPVYSQPTYSQPSYPQPQPSYAQSQPTYAQPQPTYPQSQPQSQPQPNYSQPNYSQPSFPSEVMQASSIQTQQPANIQQSSSVQRSGIPSNGSQNIGMQNAAVQSLGRPTNGNMASQSQPGATGIQQGQPAQQGQQAIQTAPQNTQGNPGMAPAANGSQTEMSALQMLASINEGNPGTMAAPVEAAVQAEVPEFAAAAMQTTMPHAGTWRVTLPGNQTITLALSPDNNFQWNAVKDGKSSSFQGQFRMESGRLTLVRSNDLQQMSGSWNGEGTNFTFKLDGATTSGLAFVRVE